MARENLSRWRRFRRWVRLQAVNVVRENSTPERTGLGFALGTFIGVFPNFALGTPFAFLWAGRLGWNRAAAVGGTLLLNPFTAPLVYPASTWVGLKILGRELERPSAGGFMHYMHHFGLAFLLGNTLFAVILATVFGLLAFGFAARHQRGGQGACLSGETEQDIPRGAAFEPAALRLGAEGPGAAKASGAPAQKPVLQTGPLPPRAA